MEKEFYPVYKIDANFDEWNTLYHFVGAKSETDLVEHFKEIFPDDTFVLDISEQEYYPDKKVGDIIAHPWFEKEEEEAICDLRQGEYNRIQRVKNLFTDKPYKIIETHIHIE